MLWRRAASVRSYLPGSGVGCVVLVVSGPAFVLMLAAFARFPGLKRRPLRCLRSAWRVAQDRCWSGGVAVFVDEAAEYVDSFDTADVVDAGGCRFRWRDGY